MTGSTSGAKSDRVATDDVHAGRSVVGPDQRVPGEPGLWVFLLGDMAIFAIMFVAFMVDRAKDPDLFRDSRESVGLAIALTNTMVLLISSLLVVIALNNVRTADFRRAHLLFSGAVVCAGTFVVGKVIEYIHLVNTGHGPDENPYFMWLFILTGVHLSHVVIGIVVLGVLVGRARRAIAADGAGRVVYEGGACYWHMVDLLWMMLFPVVYLVA
ncbi:cytochrome c oxidase subunit 3 [Gordonia sp. CPCC 206044]|uniref:cytochrome c oxidase subunit 3 n=1 Tax=Gordonia sp. CPCC 206044 TaxID=3140793 RepID=UPI003AF3FA68